MGRKNVTNFSKVFYATASDKAEYLTQKFQKNAEVSGWDSEVYSQVKLGASGFNVPEHVKSKVQDAEYGLPGEPPKAAMRQFGPVLKKELGEIASESAVAILTQEAKGLFGK